MHKDSVNSIKWASYEYGLKLAACSTDGYISIYSKDSRNDNWTNMRFLANETGVNSISWAPVTEDFDLNVF